jgi:hypothetical protein
MQKSAEPPPSFYYIQWEGVGEGKKDNILTPTMNMQIQFAAV